MYISTGSWCNDGYFSGAFTTLLQYKSNEKYMFIGFQMDFGFAKMRVQDTLG
jgi:hypothetical protein